MDECNYLSHLNAIYWRRAAYLLFVFAPMPFCSEFDMEGFVKNVLVPDLDAANANPLLRSRAVWCVSHLAGIFVAVSSPLFYCNLTVTCTHLVTLSTILLTNAIGWSTKVNGIFVDGYRSCTWSRSTIISTNCI
jgi:hypothetical protein